MKLNWEILLLWTWKLQSRCGRNYCKESQPAYKTEAEVYFVFVIKEHFTKLLLYLKLHKIELSRTICSDVTLYAVMWHLMEQGNFIFFFCSKYLVLETYTLIVKYTFLEFAVNLMMFPFGGEGYNRYCKVHVLFFNFKSEVVITLFAVWLSGYFHGKSWSYTLISEEPLGLTTSIPMLSHFQHLINQPHFVENSRLLFAYFLQISV